ncbi:hypothetical protein FNV43_RR10146 [Rhamnella rubrinervis]|uniref:Mitochondrial carnitine/acylcarnitine carrier-like protein n=1 Tax=Rhamnella rubrinervis TaxID=2594499 RepID=A0A8K0HC39_9ROSA|nr:hypothetical protein FNV43_RR10146 [Rhamnella rubrinervis]
MGDIAKDLASGTVGGAAQLIVGHPFDTIKVKLQSQPVPLPGQPQVCWCMAAFNAVLFTVRGQMEVLLRSQPGVPLTIEQQFVAGSGAGIAVSFLACPTELIKCRLQAQSALADSGSAAVAVKYGGPMDVAKKVLKSEGVRGLFKGLFPTLVLEVPGNASVFGVYEAFKQYLAGGQDTSGLGRGSLIAAGGLARASFWASVYPTDVVKSVIQGFGPAMARCVPANAACFLAYEVTRSSLG